MAPGGLMDKAINNVAKWLDNFAGDISAPAFLESVKSFVSDVGALAQAIHGAVEFIGGTAQAVKHPVGSMIQNLTGGGSAVASMDFREQFKKNPTTAAYLQLLAQADAQFKLPAGTLERQWQIESGSNLHPKDSAKGAQGPFQFLPKTAKQYGIDPYDPLQAAFGAGQYDADLVKKYHGDVAKALAAYNWGEGHLDDVILAHPTDWLLYTPTVTQKYVARGMNAQAPGVVININNNTGGSAIVSASQLGPP
jgi:soluble lytic murein transglycosylase-like protein